MTPSLAFLVKSELVCTFQPWEQGLHCRANSLLEPLLKHRACALIHHIPDGMRFPFHSWQLKENNHPSRAEVNQRSSNVLQKSS